ncbi:hypothetical protein V6N13_108561 [Hibiscus sabdariffa]
MNFDSKVHNFKALAWVKAPKKTLIENDEGWWYNPMICFGSGGRLSGDPKQHVLLVLDCSNRFASNLVIESDLEWKNFDVVFVLFSWISITFVQ